MRFHVAYILYHILKENASVFLFFSKIFSFHYHDMQKKREYSFKKSRQFNTVGIPF